MMKLEEKDTIDEIEINRININRYQPRTHFNEEAILELMESIRSIGLLQPPVVRPLDNGSYELIAGERRFRACQKLGWKTIPAMIRSYTGDLESAQAALAENIQRQDLNPLEVAKAIARLSQEFGLNQQQLAEYLGKKRSTIANYLRILHLPEVIKNSLVDGTLTMAHAKLLLSLDDSHMQLMAHEKIISGQLTVRQTQALVDKIMDERKGGQSKKVRLVERDFILEDLANKISQKLGTKVEIVGQGKKGKLIVHYFDLDQLDNILSVFDLG